MVDAGKVTMLKGYGAEALRQAISMGLVAPELEGAYIKVAAENERLEHDNRLLRGLQDRQRAQIEEYRHMTLARTGWQLDGKYLRRASKDERAGILIIGITIGCVLTAMMFCGIVWGGWFA